MGIFGDSIFVYRTFNLKKSKKKKNLNDKNQLRPVCDMFKINHRLTLFRVNFALVYRQHFDSSNQTHTESVSHEIIMVFINTN